MISGIVKRHSRLKPLTETEIKIVRSATKLFLQNGFTQTTFKMIEADSGVKVGAITYHFRTKEDMLLLLVEELMEYHREVMYDVHKETGNRLFAYAVEIAMQVSLCENNRNAWDLYYSGYNLPLTYDHIKKWAAEKNYVVFKRRLPKWVEQDFREIEVVASGIELAALKTFCDNNFTLEKKISLILDSMMMLYEVPKEERKEVISEVLKSDYEKISQEMFESFLMRI